MFHPLVSIIVPSYNQAQYLDECLQSVLEQTYQNWECIIVDDGSPDHTEEVAKRWSTIDTRFIYHKQNNSGVSAARNLGIDLAKGSFIQFLDGDDILQKNKLSYQIQILNDNPEIDIVYGGSRYFIDSNTEELYAIHPNGIVPSIDLSYTDNKQLDALLIRNVSTICATLYPKHIFEKIRFKPTVYEDYLLHIECAFEGFSFHFKSNPEGNCLIRITDNSQMMRHISDRINNTIFTERVAEIRAIYKSNFKMPECPVDIKEELDKKEVSFKKIIKLIVYNISPPLIFKIVKKIIYK